VSSDKASKTEPATEKKIKDSRKEGQVAKSPEVSAWVTTFAMTLLVPWTISLEQRHMMGVMARVEALIITPDLGQAVTLLGHGLLGGIIALGPMAVGLTALGVAANLLQVGFVPSPKVLQPKLKKLNPLPGLKNMVGPKSLWGGCKELIKLGLLGFLAYRAIANFLPALLDIGGMPLMATLTGVADAAIAFLRLAAGLGLFLAAADYVMVKKHLAKDLRMSVQEIRDENKLAEGDPMMKGAVRERQMRMSRNRMMADVATADVVLVNPTHVAVALRYNPTGGAPRVVAKGSGVIAAKIRERAEEHRVPMVRDIPLARAVFAGCEIGDEIPAELYTAVARVLAFLFSLKARGAAAGTHVVPQAALAR